MTKRILIGAVAALALCAGAAGAQDDKQPNQVLIHCIDAWDGRADTVTRGVDVLMEGNLVKQVGKSIQA